MSEAERKELQTAIEIMVLFDIKLLNYESAPADKQPSFNNAENNQQDPNVARWSPDLTSLVCFGSSAITNSSARLPMKPKTQTIIL